MTQIRNTKNGGNGDWFMKEYKKRGISTWLLLLAALLFLALVPAKTADAATAGFKTINGKTYYINADGSKQKGWLTLNKKKYYFDNSIDCVYISKDYYDEDINDLDILSLID